MTAIGLPLAILVFVYGQRRERPNDQEEIFQRLFDEYREFLKLVLENSELHLLQREVSTHELSPEQKDHRFVIFGILVSLSKRAYLLVYEERLDQQTARLLQSWEV